MSITSPTLTNPGLFTRICTAGALACVAMMAFALYEQYGNGLEPCHLCILQRIGIIACGLGFAAGALTRPARLGRFIWGIWASLGAIGAITAASRNVWVQMQPQGSIPSCTADLNVLIQMMPLHEALVKLFWSGGDCQIVTWSFLGYSMAAWVLVCASLLLVGAGYAIYLAAKTPTARS
jgi:disulfide bond formation protein DsbB